MIPFPLNTHTHTQRHTHTSLTIPAPTMLLQASDYSGKDREIHVAWENFIPSIVVPEWLYLCITTVLSCVYYPYFKIGDLKFIERLNKFPAVIQLGSGRARVCTEIRLIPKFIF